MEDRNSYYRQLFYFPIGSTHAPCIFHGCLRIPSQFINLACIYRKLASCLVKDKLLLGINQATKCIYLLAHDIGTFIYKLDFRMALSGHSDFSNFSITNRETIYMRCDSKHEVNFECLTRLHICITKRSRK
jgi:hypothetical protein